MNEERDAVTHDIIGSAFEVYRVLGYGFLERVYQRAMQVELAIRKRNAGVEHRIPVQYKGANVGGLLINFGRSKVEFKRMAFSKDRR